MIDSHHGWNKSIKPAMIGFVLSLLCTLGAYGMAGIASFILLIPILGLCQVIIQMICFFHIGVESKPRWNLMMFLFMALVVFLIIGGSIWIMYNLNAYAMM